jgi:hypothetical protein|nr:hypothetical protein [Kofleriaceae bacterium]
MADETFEGTFVPPGVGALHAPVPIAGDGTVKLHDAGITVTGFRANSGAKAFLMFMVVLPAALVVGYAVSRVVYIAPETWVGPAFGAALVAAVLTPRGAKKKPWVIDYPWSAVKKADIGIHDAELMIVVKQKPKGAIHFRPMGGRAAAKDAFARRLASK